MLSSLGRASRVGPYEIVENIGQGAMGEVYLARDSRLNRNVAMKVIADTAGADPSRRRRFAQEAQAASALNHPNIVTIHDFGTEDGISYIVTELVEGQSLREILAAGAVATNKLIDIATQIAEALGAAHEAGIVHRDLKPDNIMITKSGRVKLLDFGLAKPVLAGDAGATLDQNMTEPGLILGTVAYMSPEQARGAPVTIQSDQFAFGIILHEMATGHNPLRRESPMETLLAIAKFERPPFTPGPVSFRLLVERLLAADPEKRFSSTAEVVDRLRKLRRDIPEAIPAAPKVIRWWQRISPRTITYILAGLAVFVLGLLVAGRLVSPALGDPLGFHFVPLATESEFAVDPAWSPNGRVLAYSAEQDGVLQIFTRVRGSLSYMQVTRGVNHCFFPFWNRDSSRIYYVSDHDGKSALWLVNATGGTPELVRDDVDRAAISPHGHRLALQRGDSLWVASPVASEPKRVSLPPLSGSASFRFSPDSSRLGVWTGTQFWTVPFDGSAPAARTIGGSQANMPLDSRAGGFDWVNGGRGILLAAGHMRAVDLSNGQALSVTNGAGSEQMPAVSPDGGNAAFAAADVRYGLQEIHMAGGSSGVSAPHAPFNESWPAWSPVKDEYAFVTERSGIPEIRLRSRQSGWERTLVSDPHAHFTDVAFAPNGESIAYTRRTTGNPEIWLAPLSGEPPVRFAEGSGASWSPNGNWISFITGTRIVKQRVGVEGQPVVLAENAGSAAAAVWSPKDDWIAYLDGQPGVALQGRRVGAGQWLAISWTKHGSLLIGVKRTDDRRLALASVDPVNDGEHIIADLGPFPASYAYALHKGLRPVRGLGLSPDERTAMVSVLSAHSELWLLQGLSRPTLFSRLPF